MATEYRYEIYRPLQIPGHLDGLNHLCSEDGGGWRVHTCLPNYGEVYVFLEREVPSAPAKPEVKPARASKAKEPPAE